MRIAHTTQSSPHELDCAIVTTNCSSPQEYVGIPKDLISPVFRFTCRWRANLPEVIEVVRQTKSTLDHSIILALMEAAQRLPPADNSLAGIESRRMQQRQRAEKAQISEDAFVEQFRRNNFCFLREREQRSQAGAQGFPPRATPDMRFPTPILLCGNLCHWIEYKHYFGFPKNPYLASKEKRQILKYLTEFGPGAVVFELGFQLGHLQMDRVYVFRAKDVIDSLTPAILERTTASTTAYIGPPEVNNEDGT
jgi:hypothetical protein